METHCNSVATDREYVQKRIVMLWQQAEEKYGKALQRCGNTPKKSMERHDKQTATRK
ncbi:hypothetical protein [Prevotella pallens]|uniref:hypothetical protein n=1 Tax=Prevotella pallens TaxID=60133 RepID=UPI003C7A5419